MECVKKRIILASGSPRRQEIMKKFRLPIEIIPACGEEEMPGNLLPEEYVVRLAQKKAEEVLARCGDETAVIVAADTVVEKDDRILGKPASEAEAAAMLRALSGSGHRVWSGLCVRQGERVVTAEEKTDVYFRTLTEPEIQAYVATGEPLDKAGAYGYQGLAGVFVERIEGDFFNVMGLPVCRLNQMLAQFGITLLQ